MMDLSIFLKSVEKVKGSLKSDKNNGYFNWRPFFRMRNVSNKNCRKNENTYYAQ